MKTIELLAGTHIVTAAAHLVAHAPARADFNGITIRARYATTKPSDIVSRFRYLCDLRAVAYSESPRGKRAAEVSA